MQSHYPPLGTLLIPAVHHQLSRSWDNWISQQTFLLPVLLHLLNSRECQSRLFLVKCLSFITHVSNSTAPPEGLQCEIVLLNTEKGPKMLGLGDYELCGISAEA